MWVLGGAAAAAITSSATWYIGVVATRNLPGSAGTPALAAMLVVAVAAGFLTGAAIGRRAGRRRENLALFSCLASGVAGGAIGCTYAVTITAAYLFNYATWPQDRLDQVMVVLSYPVFGLLGLFLGATAGMVAGLLLGSVLRVAAPAR